MSQPQLPPDKPQSAPTIKPALWLTVGSEIGGLTLLIVLAAVFGGLALDKIFDTRPVLTIVLVLGSVPLALALNVVIAMRAVRRYMPSKSSTPTQPGKTYDEEDNSE